MDKPHLMCVAPYEGMKELMLNLASQRADIQMSVFVGDREEGIEMVRQNIDRSVDAIISRGITADLIAEAFPIPVIHILFSSYDILRAIKTALSLESRFAIVGLPEVTVGAKLLCDVLQYSHVKIVSLKDQNEIDDVLVELKAQGYTLIVGDLITISRAQRLALRGILIISGLESIEDAITLAKMQIEPRKIAERQISILEHALDALSTDAAIYTREQVLLYSSISPEELAVLQPRFQQLFPSLNAGESLQSVFGDTRFLYQITGYIFEDRQDTFYMFQIDKQPKKQVGMMQAIKYYNKNDLENRSYHLDVSPCSEGSVFFDLLEKYSGLEGNFLITGEAGTNIEGAATYLYRFSAWSSFPYIRLDCALCTEKTWEYFLENSQSPLYSTKATIHIENFNLVPPRLFSRLLAYIDHIFSQKRIRLIFSCTIGKSFSMSDIFEQYGRLVKSCVVLQLLPLREHLDDMWELSNFYINELVFENGKNVLGLSPEANGVLQTYPWPQNNAQLWKVLRQATLITDQNYIPSDLIRAILRQESSGSLLADSQLMHIDFEKPLKKIEHDIVLAVLKQESMNQSRAAKRLGISRSTIRKIINANW